MRSLPPPSLPPIVLVPTVCPPGQTPRAGLGGIGAALGALVWGLLAVLSSAQESPSGFINGTVGLAQFAHRVFLALSASSALAALVLGILGWSRARLLSAITLGGSLAWIALVLWGRFSH